MDLTKVALLGLQFLFFMFPIPWVGTRLQIDQAEADKLVAQARAEEIKNMKADTCLRETVGEM